MANALIWMNNHAVLFLRKVFCFYFPGSMNCFCMTMTWGWREPNLNLRRSSATEIQKQRNWTCRYKRLFIRKLMLCFLALPPLQKLQEIHCLVGLFWNSRWQLHILVFTRDKYSPPLLYWNSIKSNLPLPKGMLVQFSYISIPPSHDSIRFPLFFIWDLLNILDGIRKKMSNKWQRWKWASEVSCPRTPAGDLDYFL